MPRLHALQRRQDVVFTGARAQTQEAANGQRQRGVQMQFLRHIADAQACVTLDNTLSVLPAENHPHRVDLPAPLGPSRVKILPGVRASEMSDNTRRWPKAETFSSVTRFVIVI